MSRQALPAGCRRILRALPYLLVLLASLYLTAAFALVFFATRPDRNPFEARPEDFQLEYEDVSFKPRSGDLTLRGWLLNGSAGAPYLIFVHGLGDQRTGNKALELAARLVQDHGYNALVFDLRGQGMSDGGRVTAGEFEQDDVLGAYDFLVSRGAEAGGVGLIGRSFGAAVAIMAAAKEPGIAGVVADSPFADVEDLLTQETARKTPMPKALVPLFLPPARFFADVLYGIHLGDLRPEEDVARLRFPILIIHGEADERIPIEQGRRVYVASPAGSELWSLPDVQHADGYPSHPEEYTERVVSYFKVRFGGSVP